MIADLGLLIEEANNGSPRIQEGTSSRFGFQQGRP
jgi:hypothetical protein